MGEVDGLPAPGATAVGGARLQRPGARLRFRRHGQDHRGACTGPPIWPARNPDARVLLTTFSDTLANALHTKLKRLLSSEPRLAERIDVYSLDAIGLRLYKSHVGQATIASREVMRELIQEAAAAVGGHKFSLHFLLTEWEQVVDAWQLENWEAYRDVRTPRQEDPAAGGAARGAVVDLRARPCRTESAEPDHARRDCSPRWLPRSPRAKHPPFDFAVVDEAQDISIAHLRFFAALGGRSAQRPVLRRRPRTANLPTALLVEGPRRGHSRTLPHAARQLPHVPPNPHAGRSAARPGGDRRGRQQRGSKRYRFRVQRPAPDDSDAEERKRRDQGRRQLAFGAGQSRACCPTNSAVFVRSAAQLDRAKAAAKEAGMAFKVLDEHVETASGHVSISTMHLAKGLEFRAVAVMACDDEIIPLQERIETVGDDADLQEVYDTERHLLYVACTRARDHLLVTSVEPASEFLDDLRT